jgi:hypothetical protein
VSERLLAHTLLHNMDNMTPGGIHARMFTPPKPAWIVLTAWALFATMLIVGALAWITR